MHQTECFHAREETVTLSRIARPKHIQSHSIILTVSLYRLKLLDSLSEMDVRAAEWTNTKWDMEYSANALSLHAFIPIASSRPLGMGLPRAAWVKLNRLRSGVGRFCSSMYKWGLAPVANCECGASEQTADHIISQCAIHRAPRGMFGLMVLDDETRCWLKSLTVSI